MTTVFRLSGGGVVVYDVCFPVFVKKEAGIDATHFGQEYRIAPIAFLRVVGGDEEVTSAIYGGGYHVEQSVVRIVLDVRGVDAAADAQPVVHG